MKEDVKKTKMKKASSCIELYLVDNVLWITGSYKGDLGKIE